MSQPSEPLLTIKEVAERLNISATLVRRMVWGGQISYIDINKGGRQIMCRFTEQHIEEFLRKREIRAVMAGERR